MQQSHSYFLTEVETVEKAYTLNNVNQINQIKYSFIV